MGAKDRLTKAIPCSTEGHLMDVPEQSAAPLEMYGPLQREAVRHTADMSHRALQLIGGLGFAAVDQFRAQMSPFMWREVAAWMQLTAWYLDGLGPLLPAYLPTPAEAGRSVVERILTDPESFQGAEGTPLFAAVLGTCLVRFCREGQSIANAHLIITLDDEDLLVNEVAEFLWRHRHRHSSDGTNNKEGSE
jgi:hypothetical protein